MARTRLQADPFHKWDKEGEELSGTFEGLRDGKKFGLVGSLRTDDGKLVKFSAPTVLAKRLRRIQVGRKIWIVYEGMVQGENGKSYKSFVVDYDDSEGPLLPEPSEPEEAMSETGDTGQVPF